jgi:NADH dehydrogenase/NADH:ubiquinone oxidoreductase subunit G
VFEDQCFGIRVNHGLHTQCGQIRSGDGDYCKTCSKQASTNENSKPNAGDIRVRALGGDWEPVGKLVSYGNVMAKLGISKEQAEAEAEAQGVTIPESEFDVVKGRRGRPKKDSSSSDDEEKPKRARGRPKKSKKVVSSSAGDDLISQLVAAAQSTSESSQSDSDSSAIAEKLAKRSPKKLSDEEKAEKLAAKELADAAKAAEKAAKVAAKELADASKAEEKAAKAAAKELADAAKAEEKAAKAAAKELADAAKAEEKAAKAAAKAEKLAAKAEKLVAKETVAKAKKDTALQLIEAESAPELSTDSVFGDSSGSDDDGEAEVEKFSHDGKDYLLERETNELYDLATHEQVGVWDPVLSIITDC